MALRTRRSASKTESNRIASTLVPDSATLSANVKRPDTRPSLSGQSSELVDSSEQFSIMESPAIGHQFDKVSVAAPQAKLTVSQPSDPLEQEADHIADQVVGHPSELGSEESQDQIEKNLDIPQKLSSRMPKRARGSETGPPTTPMAEEPFLASAVSSGGSPLTSATRDYMQPQFGHDFSQVRIHTDGRASNAAQAMNAQAYTIGNNIVFAAGKYAPGTHDGDRLLAHELTHVVQQAGGDDLSSSGVSAGALHADRMVQRAPQTANDPFGIGLSPSLPSPPTFGGPLGVFLEEAAEASAKPDPSDVYEQPPFDWDSAAAPVSGPLEPEPWSPPILHTVAPLPYQRYDGKPSTRGVTPKQQEKATRCEAAFATALAVLEGSWTSASPGIKDFNNAARDAAAQGLTSISGEGWDAPKDTSQNLSQYADQQQTGPKGQQTAVQDLFKAGGTDSQVDFSGVAKSDSLDKSLKAALVTAEQDVVKAAHGYTEALGRDHGRAQSVKIAQDELKLTDAKKAEADAQSAVSSLEKEQKEAKEEIETAQKLIESVIDVAGAVEKGDPLALAKTGVGIGGVLAKMAVDEQYDQKLAQAAAKVSGIKAQVQGLKDVIGVEKVAQAVDLYVSQRTEVDTAKINFKQAIDKRKNAYDDFAKAAGAAAGGGDAGAKVQAAIQAIPVVEAVVARIQKVTDVIKLPVYNDDAGIGYRAAGAPLKFVNYLAQLKGYKGFFDDQHKTWSDRLKSLQQQATGLFSKPGAPL
jgi:hypothetical protein